MAIRNIINKILYILVILIVIFAFGEFAARVYLWHFASKARFDYFASINQLTARYGDNFFSYEELYIPHRYIGYVLNPRFHSDNLIINSLGFRGDEIVQPKSPGTYRIVAIGGSTTFSFSTLTDNLLTLTYPYLLQQTLRDRGFTQVEVINAGVDGYSSLESLINLEIRVLDLTPDMIIINDSINDIHQRIVWPPESYKGDYSGLQSVRLESIEMPPIWQYSTILRAIAIRYGFISSHRMVKWRFTDRPDTFYADLMTEQQYAGTYPDGIFEEVSAAEMLAANRPIYFERNLRNMIAVARANDIQPVLLTFTYSPLFTNEPRASSPEYQSAFIEQNALILRLGDELDVPVFDLEAVMPDDTIYFTDGRHFTEAGDRLRVDLVADFLIEEQLIPSPAVR